MAEEKEPIARAAAGDTARESKYARWYVPELNKEGLHFPDVPLDAITKARWEALPAWVRKSVDESGFYSKTKPGTVVGGEGNEPPPTAPIPRTSPPPGQELDEDGDPVVVIPLGEKPGMSQAGLRESQPSIVQRLASGEDKKEVLGASSEAAARDKAEAAEKKATT